MDPAFDIEQSILNKYTLEDLLDLPMIRGVLELQFQYTGFPISLLDEKGKELLSFGSQNLCSKFHSTNENTSNQCVRTSSAFKQEIIEGSYASKKCPLGLRDIANPIIVMGKHFGTLFYGQFLYKSDATNPELIKLQARKYGFDEEEYINTWLDTPRFDKSDVEDVVSLFSSLVSLITDSATKKVVQLIEEHKSITTATQERYQLIMEATNQGIWDWNVLTNEVFLSATWKKQIGYSDSELKNEFKTWQDHLHPDDYEQNHKELQDYLDKPQGKFINEFRFRHKDGHYLWIHNEAASIKDENGHVIRMFGTHSDITKERFIEERVKQSEIRFRSVFENSPLGKSLTTLDGQIMNNKMFAKMLGYSFEELSTKHWKEITHPDDIDKSARIVKSILDNEKDSVRFEKRYLKKDQSCLWTEVNTTLSRGKDGKPQFFITSIDDISMRKTAEKKLASTLKELKESNTQLEESNAAKNRLISVLAHDLKSPFNSLVGFLEILTDKNQKVSDEDRQVYLAKLLEITKRTHDLVENMVTWARAQHNKITPKPGILNIREITEASINHIIPLAEEKQITIENSLKQKCQIWADADMIKTVVRNLVSNSVKFTPRGGNINISCSKIGEDSIGISFSDNGQGISEDDMPKLLDISSNFSRSGTEDEKGTGFGLIICKEFIEQNQGQFNISSELSKGTTVEITLPTAPKDGS